MSELTIEQVMENTPKVFKAEEAEGVDAVVQFEFTGDEVSEWYVVIKEGKCSVGRGQTEDPTMKMTVDSQDYLDIIGGKLNAMSAFMQGKVQVKGDMSLAMKFPTYFATRG